MIRAIAILEANWKIVAGLVIGALLCWPVASCSGRKAGIAEYYSKVTMASSKASEAAAKAEVAAIVTDAVRRGESAKVQQELKDIIHEQGSDALAGPGVTGVLARLRQASGSGADTRP